MEDIKKLIKNLDKLANIIIEGYKSYEPIYRNLECIIEKGGCSCKIPNSIDIKRRENIMEAVGLLKHCIFCLKVVYVLLFQAMDVDQILS